jgi:hypothetical protein
VLPSPDFFFCQAPDQTADFISDLRPPAARAGNGLVRKASAQPAVATLYLWRSLCAGSRTGPPHARHAAPTTRAYAAVRLWLPALSEEVLNETVPLPPSAFCASTVVPSWKVTIPEGVAAPAGTVVTVAVKVTACPGADGFGVAFNVVVEAYACRFCTRMMLPALKFESPL